LFLPDYINLELYFVKEIIEKNESFFAIKKGAKFTRNLTISLFYEFCACLL